MLSARFRTPPLLAGEPKPYDGEPPASYVKEEDGEFAPFLHSEKADMVVRQYRRGLTELASFLEARDARGEVMKPAGFARFEKGLIGHIGPGVSPAPRSAEVLGAGKRAFDAIRSAVDDERVPLHARRALIGRLDRDLTVCAAGIRSNLMDVAEKIHMSSIGLEQTVRRFQSDCLEQAILEFVGLMHGKAQHFSGNEIHYVNGYRNALSSVYGLSVREDASLPRVVNPPSNQLLNQCKAFINRRYTSSHLIASMAAHASESLAEHFPVGGMLPAADLTSERLAAMKAELLPFGDLSPHAFINEFDDPSTGKTFYRVRLDQGAGRREIARALRSAGLVEPFKSRKIAGDESGSIKIKSLGPFLYTKTRLPGGDAEYGSMTPELLADREVTSSGADELVTFAVRNGDNAALRRLSERGADPFVTYDGEMLAFKYAIRHNNLEAVDIMLALKQQYPDPRTFKQMLDLALVHDDRAIFHRLVDAGIGVNLPLRDGTTPLTMAIHEGDPTLVKRLLDAGALPDVADARGASPLPLAVRGRRADLVDLLLTRQANPNFHPRSVQTPLHEAAEAGDAAIVALLCRFGGKINAVDEHHKSPLHLAVEGSHLAVVDRLLAGGADVNQTDGRGATPLHIAAHNGHREIVDRLLLDERINASLSGRFGNSASPLILAIRGGHDGVAQALLARGAKPWSLRCGEHTALHEAARLGNLHMTRLLLSMKPSLSDLKMADSNGATALHLAAQSGHSAVVALFPKIKDLREKPDQAGRTALNYAASADRPDVVRLLLSRGAAPDGRGRGSDTTPLVDAIKYGSTASAELLLGAGARLDMTNSGALDIALRTGSPEIIKLILRHRPNLLTERDQTGKTLLMRTVAHLRPEALRAVLASPIDVRSPDASGNTPLHHLATPESSPSHYAFWTRPEQRPARAAAFLEIVELLVARGADINAQNHAHETPLDLAVRSGETELVRALVALDADRNSVERAIAQAHASTSYGGQEFEIIQGLLSDARAAKRARLTEPDNS